MVGSGSEQKRCRMVSASSAEPKASRPTLELALANERRATHNLRKNHHAMNRL